MAGTVSPLPDPGTQPPFANVSGMPPLAEPTPRRPLIPPPFNLPPIKPPTLIANNAVRRGITGAIALPIAVMALARPKAIVAKPLKAAV